MVDYVNRHGYLHLWLPQLSKGLGAILDDLLGRHHVYIFLSISSLIMYDN